MPPSASNKGPSKAARAALFSNKSPAYKKLQSYGASEARRPRLQDFAPSARAARTEQQPAPVTEDTTDAAATPTTAATTAPPTAAVTDRSLFNVIQASKLIEKGNAVHKDAARIIATVAAASGRRTAPGRILRRVVCQGKKDRAIAIVLAVAEAAARYRPSAAAAAAAAAVPATLVLTANDDDADRLARLFRQIGVSPLHMTVSDANEASKSSIPPLNETAAPVIVPKDRLRRSHLLTLAAATATSGACTQEGGDGAFALATCPRVAVASVAAFFAVAGASMSHCRQYRTVIVDEPDARSEETFATVARMLSEVSAVFVTASTPEIAATAAVDGFVPAAAAKKFPAAMPPDEPRDLPVSFVTAQGLPRLQALLALLINSSSTNKVVIHTATVDGAIFLCDLLYALRVGEKGRFKLLCDCESAQEKDAHAAEIPAAARKFESFVVGRDSVQRGVVLVTAYAQLPPSGTILVAYDPITSVPHFVVRVLEQVGASVAAFQAHQTGTVAAAVEAQDGAARGAAAAAVPPHVNPTPTTSCYQHVILFFYPSEETGVLTLLASRLKQGPAPWALRPERVPRVSVNACGAALLTLQKFKDLHKKVFAIQAKAYNAYRSLMQVYTRLRPTAVFSTDLLDLNAVAEQFGYAELPLLDLRTKDTAFRPRADAFRAAIVTSKKSMKRVREHARANIEGAGPDDEWMADCPAPEDADDE